MKDPKKCICGNDQFKIEIRDAESSVYLECTKCGRINKVESDKKSMPSKADSRAVDAISRDFDADQTRLLSGGSQNPLEFPPEV